MPRYYFNFRDSHGTIPDLDGLDLAHVEAARAEAVLAAREAISEALLSKKPTPVEGRFEITDEDDWIVAVVPFKGVVEVPLTDAQYLVIERDGQWWVSLDGSRTGPYGSEQETVDVAITAAKTYERSGHTAEVAVDEPDDGVPTVYKTVS